MTELTARLSGFAERLAELAQRYRVPGASLAVMQGDDRFEAACGVVNLATGVETTPDAVFQIGSITKLFTTTLVMQLVDDGLVTLDAPIQRWLPEFMVGDAEAAAEITLRHLLTHTSGIDGDFFHDTGRGEDCVERFVLACAALPQLHRPGAQFSYCNSGFVVAGRLIEVLRGGTWDAVLRERVLDPLGVDAMGTLPEDALRHRVAVGHLADPDAGDRAQRVARSLYLARSNGPAGATPFAQARELLAFARMHLDGGVYGDRRLLSAGAVASMQEPQLQLPLGAGPNAWGLGWMLFDWHGARVIGHDGGTIGQAAYFRIVPERDLAIALLTNGGNGAAFYRRVSDALLSELAGIRLPALPEATGRTLDLEPYTGVYERLAQRCEVALDGERLTVTTFARRPLENEPNEVTTELAPIDEASFVGHVPPSRFTTFWTFLEPDERGRPRFLQAGSRLLPRIV